MSCSRFELSMALQYFAIGVAAFIIRKDDPSSFWGIWCTFGFASIIFLVGAVIDFIDERSFK